MTNPFFSTKVAYIRDESVIGYCWAPPFDPPEIFEEIPFIQRTNKDNRIYSLVRTLLQGLKLDDENMDEPHWNPFRNLIRPGDKILIKPNLVTHRHFLGKNAVLASVVHGSIIRPILDYVALALEGRGTIIIADNPVENADFSEIMRITGIEEMIVELKQRNYPADLKVIDLRPKVLKEAKSGKFYYQTQAGDPLGYVTIDLNKHSLFSEFDERRDIHYYTLSDYSIDHFNPRCEKESITDHYHNSESHRYIVSRSLLESNVIINVAKLKTHCKAGVTLSLKNMIGMVYLKTCMPHHRPGLPPDGDSYPHYPASYYVLSKKIYRCLRNSIRIHQLPGFKKLKNLIQKKEILLHKHIEHGNWKGNDTLWRTILDLNRIAIYADKEGVMKETPQRRFFVLIDGIIGQQGQGPMSGEPLASSILLAGFNPVCVDALAAKFMGIDAREIRSISKALDIQNWKIAPNNNFDIHFRSLDVPVLNFKLPYGWS